MGRRRKFDWDEARSLRASGMTYAAIAERLGVSHTSIERALIPSYYKKSCANSKKRIEALRHGCFGGCGVLVWAHTASRSGYCPSCRGERINVVRHGTETEYVQGCRCRPCTVAASEARRMRRHRKERATA